jgi:hypothetical protein
MGHYIKVLPKFKELKKQFDKIGIKEFIDLYGNNEYVRGSIDSVKFVNEKEIEWENIIRTGGGPEVDQINP